MKSIIINNDNDKYYVILQMNSFEFEYQFLVLALFYIYQIFTSIKLKIQNKYKFKIHNYFNYLKSKSKKLDNLFVIINKNLQDNYKQIENLSKQKYSINNSNNNNDANNNNS
jgi:hypothetical protein